MGVELTEINMGKHKKHKKEKSEVKTESNDDLINRFMDRMKHQNVHERLDKAIQRHTTKTLSRDLETHEEKQARRMAKRTAKRERELAAKTGMNVVKKSFVLYDEADNPFNDDRLKETFLWKKKFDAEGMRHLSKKEKREFIQKKQVKLEKEVYEARVQRHNRELERAMHEQENEDDFQLRQIRTRSKLRIKNNRGKPIDFLARYIYSTEPFEIDEHDLGVSDDEDNVDELAGYDDPLTIVRTTIKTVDDLEDILDDVKVYNKLMVKQTNKTNKEIEELNAVPIIPGQDNERTTEQKE